MGPALRSGNPGQEKQELISIGVDQGRLGNLPFFIPSIIQTLALAVKIFASRNKCLLRSETLPRGHPAADRMMETNARLRAERTPAPHPRLLE